mgnify:CR=1 FL=1
MTLTEIIKAAAVQKDLLITDGEGVTLENLRESICVELHLITQLALHLQNHTKIEHGEGVIACTPLNLTSEGDEHGRAPDATPKDT